MDVAIYIRSIKNILQQNYILNERNKQIYRNTYNRLCVIHNNCIAKRLLETYSKWPS